MKRYLVAIFAGVLLATSLTACGKKEEENSVKIESSEAETKAETESQTEETSQEATEEKKDNEKEAVVDLNENNNSSASNETSKEMVNIKFPAEAFNGAKPEEIKGDAIKMNATATINEDGSVVYTMTKANQEAQLKSLKEELTSQCNGITTNGKYPFIKEIKLDERLENITVKADKAQLLAQDGVSFVKIQKNCLGYQTLNGVSENDLKVVLHLIDATTGEEFKTETYKKDGVVK